MTAIAPAAPFVHEALLYDDDHAYLEGTVPFIEEGLAAGEPVLVAVPRERLELIRGNLDAGAGEGLQLVAMETMGRNPAWIIPAWAQFVESRPANRPARGIGEPIWASRTPDELVECERHESLLNAAFRDVDSFQLLCPYNRSALGPEVIAQSERTHPHVAHGGERRPSAGFESEVAAYLTTALPDPPAGANVQAFAFDFESQRSVRRQIVALAEGAGLDEGRVDDVETVVAEALSNSIRHGGGDGRVLAWRTDRAVVLEFHDIGTIAEPLAGRLPPRAEREGGRGLWLMNQLSDLVQIRRLADDQVVRVHFSVG